MSEQGKRLQKRKEEDAAFNKMLLWLAGSVVLEGLTLLLRRFYIDFSYTDLGLALAEGLDAFFGVFRFLGAVLFIAGCVWTFLWARNGKKKLLPVVLTCVVLWLWVASVLCYGLNQLGMTLLCALPVAVAVLSAIFFLYQREFFYNGILLAVGVAALWVYRQIYMNHPRMSICGFAAVWVFLILVAVAAFRLSRKDGKVGSLRVLPAGASYLSIYLTCAVVAAALLAAVLVSAVVSPFASITAAFYLMFVLIAWLFCLAVYYTVKLM